MSMAGPPGTADTCCLASVTQPLPGPNSLSQRGTRAVPSAIAAIACAPPRRNTVSMPHRRAANSTAGSTLPSTRGGVHSTTSRQPASCAGTPSISAVEGSGALPAGTYRPTRVTGRWMRSQTTPGAVSTRTGAGMAARWKTSMRPRASTMACFRAGSSAASAAVKSASPTAATAMSQPSSRAVSWRSAASPLRRTVSMMSATARARSALAACAGRRSTPARPAASRAFQSTVFMPASSPPAAPACPARRPASWPPGPAS